MERTPACRLMSPMEKTRTTQATSEETGLSIDTLRYYERIGLIDSIERAANGHRRYKDADIVWILFLKQLRATGMSIAQMQVFAQLRRDGDASITQRREMLEAHRQNLEQQIQSIHDFMSLIDTKIAAHKQREKDLG